jgi:two-component system OmpR family response regulator
VRTPVVLVVEDDPNHQYLLRRHLSGAGYAVVVAGTLAHARTLLSRFYPDLIVLDLLLPDGHGATLCHEVKRARPELPIVVASAMLHRLEAGQLMCADRVMAKPVAPDEMAQAIASLLTPGRRAS